MHLFFLITCLSLPVFILAWDIAVVTDLEIEFLDQGRLVGIASDHLNQLGYATYDPVKGDLFVSDNSQLNASIFKINMLSSTGSVGGFVPVVDGRQIDIVRGVAFDVVTSTLFWSTGLGHTIHKLSNMTDNSRSKTGDIVHKFTSEIPIALAVDSCRQYLYWTNCNHQNASIERSTLDGSNREMVVQGSLYSPLGIVVDQQTKKLYWCDAEVGGYFYKIERSDLNGRNREVLIDDTHHEPVSITVTAEKIYWFDRLNKAIWSIPKDKIAIRHQPEHIKTFNLKNQPQSIISNIMYHKYEEKDCQSLIALKRQIDENMRKWIVPTIKSITSITGPSKSFNITIDENICLNNGSLLPNGRCDCMKGYSGSRCEVSLCYNYCVDGTCTVDAFGSSPKCKCPIGKIGERCEFDLCKDTCLNEGVCIATADTNEVSCKCQQGYTGERCETRTAILNKLCRGYCLYYEITIAPVSDHETTHSNHSSIESYVSKAAAATESPPLHVCNCSDYSKEEILHVEQLKKSLEGGSRASIMHKASPQELAGSSASSTEGRAGIIVTTSLSVTCVILLLAVILLSTRVCKLKKRPRIRKRIVVNRPPLLGCRQQSPPSEQCEITIENCCNMNICETPCFESEFQSSKATFSKSKSEDKKGLLENVASCSREEMF